MDQDIFGRNYALTLTDDEVAVVMRPIAPGDWGGHQHIEHEFQGRLVSGSIDLTQQEVDRAFKYAWGYGEGTWQKYCRPIIAAAMRAGWTVPERGTGDAKLDAAIDYFASKRHD